MGLLKEFRDFAMRGNVIDMAVGIVIGTAFGAIVASLVADVIMPPVGLLLSGVDFAELGFTLRSARVDEMGVETPAVMLNYGLFINAVIRFVIVAFAVFMVIRLMNRATEMAKKKEAVAQPETAPEQSMEVALLSEIRDLLRQREV